MGGYAWVTLATNDSYSLGALVLARSLEQVGTRQQLAILVTPGVTNAMRSKLTEVFNVVQEVNLLDSRDEENLRLLKRPELGVTFTKLHCWRLTQFDKCVFLDADTLVLENCDELFDREEFSAAPDIGWPDCFNSGVFVYRPSNETFEKLIQFAIDKGSFDGGDQGLLNLYFSDWAHKDISKHLPFIYNMSSTACYSYLPAFKQFGKTAKIIHFIGATKPWLQYFDTETKKVHPSEGLKHLEEILQRWWDLFCAIHPSLSPEMTSHTDTVHGSQSSTHQIAPHTPHLHHQNFPSSSVPHPAEDYQNVWDPWEEYDSRQPQEQHSVQSSIPDHTFHISQNTFSEQVCETPSQVHGHVGHSQQVSHPVHIHESPSHQLSHPVQIHQLSHPVHIHQLSHPVHIHQLSHPVHIHQSSHPVHSFENQSHSFQHHESHSHNIHSHIHHSESRNQFNESQFHYNETQTQQNQFFESHNTNAVSDADHHSHNHPPSPTYSHPQPHSRHYEAPPPCPVQKTSRFTPPPSPPPDEPVPRLPDECVTTTTVSNEIILQTGSNEDTNKNAAGLAGAFAKLTLGAPRTPEQAALDDHLRRQGWEVGNIDYLGRDSFQNIWSKICETLSAAPEQPIPKPESPKVEAKAKEVPPPAEVKSVEKAQTESEEKQKSEQADADDQVVVESRIPEAVAQPPSRSPEQVAKEVEVPKETPVTPKESELPPEGPPVESATVTSAPTPDTSKESELPPEVPPVTSATVTSTPTTPEPVTSVTPTPVSSAPSTPAPVTPAPDTSAQTLVSTTPVPSAISTPVTSVPVSPAPITPASDTSATVTPAPASSAPVTPAPVSSAPVTPAPASSAPVAPVSSAPVTPASTSSAPVTPTPVTPAAEVIAPVIPDSVSLVPSTQKPVTPDVETSAPITPAPVSSAPITPAPISSATVIPAEAPAPSTPVPITPDVDTAAIVTPASAGVVAPAPVVISAQSSAVKDAAVEKPASVVKASKESDVPATKSSVAQSIGTPSSKEVSAPVTTSSEVPIPQVCPVAPQPKVSAKSSGSSTTSETVSSKEPPKKLSRDPKKLKEETQAPKTQVTEPIPPTTPVSPQVKETKPALEVDPIVPDTPPVPAQESSAAPTPAPRKSNRSDKKTGTKTKK